MGMTTPQIHVVLQQRGWSGQTMSRLVF